MLNLSHRQIYYLYHLCYLYDLDRDVPDVFFLSLLQRLDRTSHATFSQDIAFSLSCSFFISFLPAGPRLAAGGAAAQRGSPARVRGALAEVEGRSEHPERGSAVGGGGEGEVQAAPDVSFVVLNNSSQIPCTSRRYAPSDFTRRCRERWHHY